MNTTAANKNKNIAGEWPPSPYLASLLLGGKTACTKHNIDGRVRQQLVYDASRAGMPMTKNLIHERVDLTITTAAFIMRAQRGLTIENPEADVTLPQTLNAAIASAKKIIVSATRKIPFVNDDPHLQEDLATAILYKLCKSHNFSAKPTVHIGGIISAYHLSKNVKTCASFIRSSLDEGRAPNIASNSCVSLTSISAGDDADEDRFDAVEHAVAFKAFKAFDFYIAKPHANLISILEDAGCGCADELIIEAAGMLTTLSSSKSDHEALFALVRAIVVDDLVQTPVVIKLKNELNKLLPAIRALDAEIQNCGNNSLSLAGKLIKNNKKITAKELLDCFTNFTEITSDSKILAAAAYWLTKGL